jgi:hypothetical protein
MLTTETLRTQRKTVKQAKKNWVFSQRRKGAKKKTASCFHINNRKAGQFLNQIEKSF